MTKRTEHVKAVRRWRERYISRRTRIANTPYKAPQEQYRAYINWIKSYGNGKVRKSSERKAPAAAGQIHTE